jgi:glycosyltransferase
LFGHYDVLHYHAEGSCAMLWIPHLFHKKIIVTIHGLDWQRSKWGGFATKYIKYGEKCAVKYADQIIVLSENVKKYFKDTYNRETVFVPNGIEKPTIKKANIIKNKYDLNKDDYILFLARIVPEKGLDDLIDAYEKIKTDKKLVIAGGASHTNDYLENIKERTKNNENIIMSGFVQGDELDELYSNAYLYCLPSHIEGMPISLLEALSYGCNVLISNIDENIQVAEKYATTFKMGDVSDLTNKLEACIEGKNRYNDNEIQEYVLNKYSWDDVVEKTLKIYKEIGG